MRLAKVGWLVCVLLGLGASAAGPPVWAVTVVPEGNWIVNDRVAIESFGCGGMMCGKIVWLQNPALRTPTMCGRLIVWNLRHAQPGQWTGGWFFDPENGSTYNLSARLLSDGTISARIYEGVAWLGRTEILRRIRPGSLKGWC